MPAPYAHATDRESLSPEQYRRWKHVQSQGRKQPQETKEQFQQRMSASGLHRLCISCGSVRPFSVVRCQCGCYLHEVTDQPVTTTRGTLPDAITPSDIGVPQRALEQARELSEAQERVATAQESQKAAQEEARRLREENEQLPKLIAAQSSRQESGAVEQTPPTVESSVVEQPAEPVQQNDAVDASGARKKSVKKHKG